VIRGLVVVALTFAATGCAKKRIPECDAFVKTIEKIAACPKVADDQRKTILESAATIRQALQDVDAAGGVADAPADLVSSMRDACRTQDQSLQQMYADCLP
jgi:uroporphyrinogen-III decarboxylase